MTQSYRLKRIDSRRKILGRIHGTSLMRKFDRIEVQKGLAETRQYILSHHDRSEWYRCYDPVIFGRRIHICARCLGIYPGIIAGILAYPIFPTVFHHVIFVGLLPLPALVDWTLTAFTKHRGYNIARTITGALLGYGYGLGIVLLFSEFEMSMLILGGIYVIIAGTLLTKKETVES